jgi:hypothetical protein
MIIGDACCPKCQRTIHEIETYCMRGPFLSHRLARGLVNNLSDLGDTISMPLIIDGLRHHKTFPISEYPKFLVLPQLSDHPGIVGGNPFKHVTTSIWGNEEELRALNEQGNAVLVEDFKMDFFVRALAKIAHGFIVGQYRLENFQPLLPKLILGEDLSLASYLVGNWPEDGMHRTPNLLHQVGAGFMEMADGRVMINARIRLFAEHEHTPIYRIVVGFLSKPLDDVLAVAGLQSVPPRS